MSDSDERFYAEAEAFLQGFIVRAAAWDERPGDFELAPEPWTDPDHPDPALDAAYRGGIALPKASIARQARYARRRA